MQPSTRTSETWSDVYSQFSKNRAGLIGFGLSILQLVIHGAWIAFVTWLSVTGQAAELQPGAWQLWLVTILILSGAVVTAISLYFCVYGSIRGQPKSLALIGLSISFFSASFTTFALILNFLSSGT